mmetsp:Transcript_30860/g.48369  ORF Transcript_30860/g.48369 Transcript_30860/m.48369 type:complete len:85 (-) Transcript_30860:344-598(-)
MRCCGGCQCPFAGGLLGAAPADDEATGRVVFAGAGVGASDGSLAGTADDGTEAWAVGIEDLEATPASGAAGSTDGILKDPSSRG